MEFYIISSIRYLKFTRISKFIAILSYMLFFIVNYAYVYVCVNVCWVGVRYMCECSCQQNTENWILWGCVTGGCELPYMSSRNWKWILCKSRTCFWLMSHIWPILGDFNYRSNNYIKKKMNEYFSRFLFTFARCFEIINIKAEIM